MIRAEYLEILGLRLIRRQVQRLWGLDAVMCKALLAALVDVRFLRCTRHEAYIRVEGEQSLGKHAACIGEIDDD